MMYVFNINTFVVQEEIAELQLFEDKNCFTQIIYGVKSDHEAQQ